jgi:perosamine synthetase
MSKKLWRVGQKELDYIKEAIDSGLKGIMNQRLEENFAKKIGAKYAISVNSGTSALHCGLAAMGVRPGDEVIVPPLTFISPAFAVLYLGGVPVFADIDPDTFTIDPAEIRKKITPRTKAIIPVALYGLPSDMAPIMEIAEEHNLFVIEDSAECLLGKYKGRISGTIGDMAIFSFERSKHITTGNGGMIITNNEKLAEKARKFSVLGYSTLKAGTYETKPSKDVIQNPDFDRHLFIAPNYRLPEVCAAMALAQLEKLDDFVKMRLEISKLYNEAVQDCDWLKPQKVPEGFVNSYWTYAMKLEGKDKGISWNHFRKTYLEQGGDSFYAAWRLSYMEPALSGMEFKRSNIKYEKGLCPIAEELQPKLIQLKTNYGDMEYAKRQALALEGSIKKLGGHVKGV